MDFIETAFLKAFNMSITASYVILVVLLIGFCIRTVPKNFSYMLWSVVGFRLLFPVSFSSIISIFNCNLFDMTVAQSGGKGSFTYVPSNIGYTETPRVTLGISTINSFITESLPVATPAASINPMQIVVSIATILWCMGIATLLTYSIFSYIRVKRKVDGAVFLDKNIYECDNISSPFVLGIIKPKIYIPFRMNKQEREYILCHEEHHIRRLDHIVKPLSFLLLTVYWFNPLVWIAYLSMCRDMEMSCDEKVLSDMGMSIKKDYSMSLLSFSTKSRFLAASPLAFGESAVKRRVKNVLNFKKPNAWKIIVTTILCIGVIVACATNSEIQKITPSEELEIDTISSIYGFYEFDKNIYTNPLSSFWAVKGHMPYFGITENALMIIDDKDGSVQKFGGVFSKEPLSKEDFDLLFEWEMDMPDISQYKECYQYGVFSQYSLYVMDQEVWLASFSKDKIWSIYRLAKRDDIARPADFSLTPNEGLVLEICYGSSVIHTVTLNDDEFISVIKEIILSYDLKTERSHGIDVEEVGHYFRFYDPKDTSKTIYYAFSNETISEQPQIQIGKGNGDYTRTGISQAQYESLYALWGSHMLLSKSAIITSGNEFTTESVYYGDSSITPQDVKDQLFYLEINPIDDNCPFRVYVEGVQKYGHYEIYDAETFEKLDFIRPSGLEPQTYILKNAVSGRRYIIELYTGYNVGYKTYGAKILFGVSIP